MAPLSVNTHELDQNVQFNACRKKICLEDLFEGKSAWLANNECNFMRFVEQCFVPCVYKYGLVVSK